MIGRVVASLVIISVFVPAARAQVTLEQKVAEGVTLRTKSATKVHQVMTTNGMDFLTDVDEQGVARSVHGTRRGDGTLPIEIVVESFKIRMALPGVNEINIDSADPEIKTELPQLAFIAELLRTLRGSSYTVVLDAKNHVKFVEGAEKNLTKVGELSPQGAAAVKQRFDAERLKREYEEAHDILPEGFVREGEPWEKTSTIENNGQNLIFKNRYEYKGTIVKDGKTLDRIEVKAIEATYKMDPNADSPAKVTRSDLKVDSSEGTILFDREAGTVVERSSKTRIKGDMDLTVGGMDLAFKFELTLDSTVTTEKAAR